MRRLVTVGLFAAALLGPVSPALGQTVVTVPNGAETTNPSLGTCIPFGNSGGNGRWRYQQIFDASSFAGTAGVIDRLRFRRGSNQGPFESELDLEVRLSHTTRDSGNISTTFADNVTEEQVVVVTRSSDPNVWTSLSSATSDPRAFDVALELDDAFLYNGTDNLLLDVVVHGTDVLSDPDGGCIAYDSFTAFGSVVVSNDPDRASGSLVASALVSQFVFLEAGPDISVSPETLDFGVVGILETAELIVTVSNTGTEELVIDGISVVGDPSFFVADPIASVPAGQAKDLIVSFSPTTVGTTTAVLEIASQDPDEPLVSVFLVGDGAVADTGVVASELQSLVAEGVQEKWLYGTGPGKSAKGRLEAFVAMVDVAMDLMAMGLNQAACGQFEAILKKADGDQRPPDFVAGSAMGEINGAIHELMTMLVCG